MAPKKVSSCKVMFITPELSARPGGAGRSGQQSLLRYALFSVPSASSSDCGDNCQTPSSPAAELQEADSETSIDVVEECLIYHFFKP